MNTTASGATFSPCRTWRYHLWRRWGTGRSLVVIGLNPSTADEHEDDPTIRRCIGFAKREGCDALDMLNLHAFRSTDPNGLWQVADPVGPDNDATILRVASTAGCVVAAWGANAKIDRTGHVLRYLRWAGIKVLCLGKTKGGQPKHPLYLAASTPLVALGGLP